MIRSVVGIIVGVLVGGFVVFLLELPGMLLYPLPPGLDFSNRQAVEQHLATIPTSLMAIVVLAWAVGPFCAALATCWIVKRSYHAHATVIGVIFTLLDLVNLIQLPSPWWMWVGGLVAPLLTALLGARLARRLWPARLAGPQLHDMREKGMAC